MASFYSAFGQIAASFSQMESELRVLISGIAFKDDFVTASAFLDGSQLGENICILRKITRPYWNTYRRIPSLVKRLESLRETRNLFIHGLWNQGTFGKPSGIATVTDLRTTFTDGHARRTWKHQQTRSFTENDFALLLSDIQSTRKSIRGIMAILDEDEGLKFHIGGGTSCSAPQLVEFNKT